MALPTPTPSGPITMVNPGFETGDATGWTLGTNTAVTSDSPFAGVYSLKFTGSGGAQTRTVQDVKHPAYPGMSITTGVQYQQGAASRGQNPGYALVQWFNSSGALLTEAVGNVVDDGSGGAWHPSTLTSVAPAGAAFVSVGVTVFRTNSNASWADNLTWNYAYKYTAVLDSPGIAYTAADTIPCRITIVKDGTANVVSVQYWKMTQVSGVFEDPELLGTVTDAPYAFNAPAMTTGTYAIYAVVTLDNGSTITTNSRTFAVGAAPVAVTREYKASNAYTYVVGEGFIGLGSGLPSNAVVTGVELEINYALDILVRSKDHNITDPNQFTSAVAFSAVTGGVFETALMSKSGGQYTVVGSPTTANIEIAQPDFSIIEDAVADGTYRWTVYRTDTNQTVSIGGENAAFNVDNLSAADFLEYAMGIRFYPTLGSKPDYADDGDACVRVKINSWKMKVYFDAGSVEYYFASPDKTQVLKGTLVAYNVESGDFRNSDASGEMQLRQELVQMDGTQTWIGGDWTIHSHYPPADNNQIGNVEGLTDPYPTGSGMRYNELPGQKSVFDNRSRYVFITANFYGDTALESIYGANGVDRGFAYNGLDFYKIQTQPDPLKDKPRHVAFHHSHLALGYSDGRVDISVVGEPFNFTGDDGASSWAIGDSVTGLLPLSGAILGVFCRKSIVGISGTTVDNFATQTLSPSLGAIEYTVTNMGYPVYANAYGIYTLSQTQQYGDFLGMPLSQQVSPWLRPRLVRKYTSAKEVVVAWPVRSKNQYKLAFSDGYVLSMTMNYGQQSSPTFSTQKYFITDDFGDYANVGLYEYPSIYPIAISSELDDGGEERIHVAHRWPYVEAAGTVMVMNFNNGRMEMGDYSNAPPWFAQDEFVLNLVGADSGYFVEWVPDDNYWYSGVLPGGGGTNVSGTMTQNGQTTQVVVTWVWS